MTRTCLKLLSPSQLPRLANYAKYRALTSVTRRRGGGRLTFAPLNIVVAVTARCNKRCEFCYFRGELNPPNADELELTYDTFLRMLDHPLIAPGLRVALTGGEPLLNKDVCRMASEAQRRGHIVGLITNGTLLDKRADEILADPPDVLTVSYYPEDHDRLAETLPQFGGAMTVKLNFVLSRERLADLERLLQLAAAANARLVDVENMTITPNNAAEDEPLREEDVEFERLRSRLSKQYGRRVPINWRKPLATPDPNTPVECRVFRHSLHIDAKGRLSPCCQWPLHTYQDDIFANAEAWNSDLMVSLREQLAAGEIPEYCRGCSALYEDYLGV